MKGGITPLKTFTRCWDCARNTSRFVSMPGTSPERVIGGRGKAMKGLVTLKDEKKSYPKRKGEAR